MLTIIVFIIILGLLIFVHELGHFLTARRSGIKAEEFGFGFPPRIVGFQLLTGEKKEEKIEVESVQVKKTDIKLADNEEIIQETVTEKMRKVLEMVPVKKWRIIWGSRDGDTEKEKKELTEAWENKYKGGTIYSINWIPLGGFVKIKGEGGESKNDPDSFASKKAGTRIKVLAAGVIMNFILAWFLYSVGYMVGSPEAVQNGEMIQIARVVDNSPASQMGLKIGDEIMTSQTGSDEKTFQVGSLQDVQNYINSYKGGKVELKIKRGQEKLTLEGNPRLNAPQGEGSLGIELVNVSVIKYPWYQAFWMGLLKFIGVFELIITVFYGALKSLLFGQAPVGVEIAGPVKIFGITGDYVKLGYMYVIQFVALLSINLGIINILPIPALDGGRILFIIIEKIKGKPVNEKTEQLFHTIGFTLLLLLMFFIILRELSAFIK